MRCSATSNETHNSGLHDKVQGYNKAGQRSGAGGPTESISGIWARCAVKGKVAGHGFGSGPGEVRSAAALASSRA
jgi:hypothetical protein